VPETDLYCERATCVHRLDPRVKLFGVTALFVGCLLFVHPAYVAAIAALVLVFAGMARALGNLWRMRLLLTLLLVFAGLLWSLFARGRTPLVPGWPLLVTRESALYGLGAGLRLATMVAAGLAFLSVTRVEESALALQRLGVPFVVTFAFSTAFRLVPTLLGSAAAVIEAQRSRGLDLESGSLFSRLFRHVPLLVPTVASAIRMADLMAMALESRGFRAGPRRTSLIQLRFRIGDWAALGACFALVGVCAWLRWKGLGIVSGIR
jgi:energy-coupling factor transport system permease protein